MHRAMHTISGFLLGALCFSLMFMGIGSFSPKSIFGVTPFELILIVMLPLFLFHAWQIRRSLSRSLLFWGIVTWVLGEGISAVAAGRLDAEWTSVARGGLMSALIVGVAAMTIDNQLNRTAKQGLIRGAALSLTISLIGYVFFVVTGADSGPSTPFVYFSSFFNTAELPRLSGTYHDSPQHYGEYLLTVISVVVSSLHDEKASGARQRLYHGVAIVATVALFLTFSFSVAAFFVWSSVVISVLSKRHRWFKQISILAAGTVAVFIALWMNIGLPFAVVGNSRVQETDCRTLDKDHILYAAGELRGMPKCFVLLNDFPYRSLETTYRAAKETAVRAVSKFFPWGTGYRSYPAWAAADSEQKLSNAQNYYIYPHCTYLSAAAVRGVFGIFGLILIVAGVFQLRPSQTGGSFESVPLWGAAVAFAIIGVNVEVMENRSLWLLLALLWGHRLRLEDTTKHLREDTE